MQRGKRGAETVAHFLDFRARGGELFAVLLAGERERRFDISYNFGLVNRLARVKLETKFAHAYRAKAFFYYLQRRLLFSDEKHALALVHCVGDYIGYGLALARSRGAV